MLICWPFVWIWDIHPWGSQPRGAIWNETLECPYSMHPIHSLDAMHCNKDTWRADRPPHPHYHYRMHYASKCCKCLWYLPTFPTFSKVFRFIFLSFFPNFPGPSLRFLTFSCIFPIFFFGPLVMYSQKRFLQKGLQSEDFLNLHLFHLGFQYYSIWKSMK